MQVQLREQQQKKLNKDRRDYRGVIEDLTHELWVIYEGNQQL